MALGLGLFFGLNSWDKNLYVQWNPSQGRGLASGEAPSTEIVNLSSEDLIQNEEEARSVLFSRNNIKKTEDSIAFYLGELFVPNPYKPGEYGFICGIYDLVDFKFVAMGYKRSGDPGKMFIQSPCNDEDETNEEGHELIGPFWIPEQEIMANPSQETFEMPDEGSDHTTYIRFENASVTHTEAWLLQTVKFFRDEDEDNAFIVRFVPPKNQQPSNEDEEAPPEEAFPYFEISLGHTER